MVRFFDLVAKFSLKIKLAQSYRVQSVFYEYYETCFDFGVLALACLFRGEEALFQSAYFDFFYFSALTS